MRLLHTTKFQLVEVLDDTTPSYAILSHTWDNEEVVYQDLQPQRPQHEQPREPGHFPPENNVHGVPDWVKAKKGFQKVARAAGRARQDGYEYIWIDTCCIDKSSSAELSEAINSMYRWYQEASICYALLSDVTIDDAYTEAEHESVIRSSRWFTRGWTLQELIAPADVEFYSAEWRGIGNKLGSKRDDRFSMLIGPGILSNVTGVEERVLSGGLDPQDVSVATRMSWAALRRTTRVEDIAYCLLGIFSVNMPLLYGEGSRAFTRLQEAIMRETDDQSIFAWALTKPWPHRTYAKKPRGSGVKGFEAETLYGLLADSPAHFAASAGIRPFPPPLSGETTPTTISSQGIHLQLYLQPYSRTSSSDFWAVLDCKRRIQGLERCPAIHLRHLWGNQYARVFADKLELVKHPSLDVLYPDRKGYQSLYVRRKPIYLLPDFHVSIEYGSSSQIAAAYPPNRWDSTAWILKSDYAQVGGVMGVISMQGSDASEADGNSVVVVGIQSLREGSTRCWCCSMVQESGVSLEQIFDKLDTNIREGLDTPASLRLYNSGISSRVKQIVRHGRRYVYLAIGDKPDPQGLYLESSPSPGASQDENL
ncbi:Vegetative incompatibility protein HET-E-1-like protein 14 [Colletotrichum chlorophyti]|uniref:Vegetative incompatibility protein HET-E-1-like protein 14 n=1 Tax=Colletotrichum chlorophyti TaxID=708187 RepID=A0A1Q8RR05_9PEZI|nr:Vegetative incompatibility protein HET-E-1-like protein 14 [Colletotrichum chlorophyti]